MDKKFVFVYFGQKALCSTPEQAFDFINDLFYRGNSKIKLCCNKACMKWIWKLFAGRELREGGGELATTGCSTTRIMVYPALADTLEEHERIYAENAAEAKAERLRDNKIRLQQINARLDEQKHGWYAVNMDYSQMSFSSMDSVICTFEGKVLAGSGRDAYAKLTKYIDDLPQPAGFAPNTPVNNSFPEPFSNHFYFEYLGEKKGGDPDEPIIECPDEDREANEFLRSIFG